MTGDCRDFMKRHVKMCKLAGQNAKVKTYLIVKNGTAIKCLCCGLTSHNPNDVAQRYCGFCHAFHEPFGAAS